MFFDQSLKLWKGTFDTLLKTNLGKSEKKKRFFSIPMFSNKKSNTDLVLLVIKEVVILSYFFKDTS